MAKTKLKWHSSYETLAYDTPDDDMEINQYADHPDGDHYVIRTKPKVRANTRKVDKAGFDLTGLTKVNVVRGKIVCYSQFILPGGGAYRVREPDDLQEKLRTIKDQTQPSKELDFDLQENKDLLNG